MHHNSTRHIVTYACEYHQCIVFITPNLGQTIQHTLSTRFSAKDKRQKKQKKHAYFTPISTGLALHLEIQLQKRQKDIHPAQTVAMRRKGKKDKKKEPMILGVIRQCVSIRTLRNVIRQRDIMTSASKFRPQQYFVVTLFEERRTKEKEPPSQALL